MNFVGDENILELNRVVMAFGGLMALSNISFQVKRGMIKAIIGPNGAGKTTLFNIITGSFPPTEGKIIFKGLPIEHLKAHKIAERGISRTFQTVELFGNMTVLENVMLGCHTRIRSSFLSSASLSNWSMSTRRHSLALDSHVSTVEREELRCEPML